MRTPALAVVGADHQIIRSTDTFRRKCERAAQLCKRAPELELVLTGRADAAVLEVGDFSLTIEAITDAAGKRQAMLSLPGEDLAADPDSPLAALREAAEESSAIVWIKDLEGRYLYVNPRYEHDLETSEERLQGKADADLPPVETVDGPRLRYTEDGLEEPLQLEYSVPAFESRPPMAAFRFALRDGSGQPVATCGVAAPSSQAQVAREEAVRLMQLERWNRLDPLDVRAEVLEQWHVQARPGPVEEAEAVPASRNGHSKAPVKVTDEPAVPPASGDGDDADDGAAPDEPTAPDRAPPGARSVRHKSDRDSEDGAGAPFRREEEWVRQLRQAAAMSPSAAADETAGALQTDLQLARKWAERADQLQGDLHEAHARLREAEAEAQQAEARIRGAEAEAQQATAATEAASEEANRVKAELEQARLELEREKAEADTARSEAEAARRELDQMVVRVRARLGDLESALERESDASASAE